MADHIPLSTPQWDSLALTTNLSLTFNTSLDARIDFMFHVIEGSSLERTTDFLAKSWANSPVDTLKLLFYTRDIRKGKGCRAQFLLCLKWIFQNQFDALLKTLKFFPEFGCYKDFFNMLVFMLFDDLPYDAYETMEAKKPAKIVSNFDRIILKGLTKEQRHDLNEIKSKTLRIKRKWIETVDNDGTMKAVVKRSVKTKEEIDLEAKKRDQGPLTHYEMSEIAHGRALPKKTEKNQKIDRQPRSFKGGFLTFKTDKAKLKALQVYRNEFVAKKLETDEKFRKLYDAIVEACGEQLAKDYQAMEKENGNVSLLSKWIPNRDRQFDKHLRIQLPIAKNLLARFPEFQAKLGDDKQTVFEFEKVVTKLRKRIYIPEIDMSMRNWDDIVFDKVTSKALFRYKNAFVREAFDKYKEFIGDGKKVKGGALTPAEIIREYCRTAMKLDGDEPGHPSFGDIYGLPENMDKMSDQKKLELGTLDAQWLALIKDIKAKGPILLENSLAVCDVSGSMCTTAPAIQPIFGAVGLTLLLMAFTGSDEKVEEKVDKQGDSGDNLADKPVDKDRFWASRCLAFSETPKLFDIPKGPLLDQIREITKIDAGMSTNLNATFDLILQEAKTAKLTQAQMPRVLFIFSDMEFNCACPGLTNFEVMKQQFKAEGYQMPMVVFWNLNGDKKTKSTPVQVNEHGVVLLSGYSAQTLSFFDCNEIESMSPLNMLNKILQDERYAGFDTLLQ